ncbi:MAG: fumarate hydratase [Acidilobaceae archaeon]|nr:fumarate hydratase [Acidilobaceae archaeon]MCX8165188.1 fumarate hydratase [Acidilobaceae archaeon]MDW7974296.1 fumarate hydratase [Sulfolobales archaeon]
MKDLLREATVRLIEAAATSLPKDVEDALLRAYEVEEAPAAKSFLKAMIDNVRIARQKRLPICQDTGAVLFYVKVGDRFPHIWALSQALKEATVEATRRVPLRPNTIDVFTGKNPGDNTGRNMPWIEWEIEEGDDAEVSVMLKGGGSEIVGRAKTLLPAEGIKGIMKYVIEAVYEAGPQPCPPVIVGVGIGPTVSVAMKLASKSLLRPVGQRHEEPEVARLEQALLEAINEMGYGAHGMGGKVTAFDVHVEHAARHPASLSVAVVLSCWATRRATMRVRANGEVQYLSHPELNGG